MSAQPVIGIIGMGDMGRMYAKRLSAGGIKTIYVCDLPEKYESLKTEFQGTGITPLKDGHAVSRISDFIIYSVEAAYISSVVEQYGPSTKFGATVAGQTSVKAPEKEAFEKWLPDDVGIVSVHSLHGPSVTTEGQPLIIIHHRGPVENVKMVEDVFRSFKSRYVYLSYEEHDMVTANTQAVTHAAFLSMGTAWQNSESYPWETTRYVSGIEVVKVNIALRIYSAKWHVYAGLALLNPSAQKQIKQYAKSTTDLFKLMCENRAEELADRVWAAREGVFGWKRDEDGVNGLDGVGDGGQEGRDADGNYESPSSSSSNYHQASTSSTSASSIEPHLNHSASTTTSTNTDTLANTDANANTTKTKATKPRAPILLSEDILDQFSLGNKSDLTQAKESPNSHLSLLAMVDCWHKLGIRPFEHLDVAGTPVFMLWIGVAEYLFRTRALLSLAISAGLSDHLHRPDDIEFVLAARGWSECVSFGNFDLYERRFMETARFFAPRFGEATRVGGEMIKAIQEGRRRA